LRKGAAARRPGRHRFVGYDGRGCGLSDREVRDRSSRVPAGGPDAPAVRLPRAVSRPIPELASATTSTRDRQV